MKAGPAINSKYDIPLGANQAVEDLICKIFKLGSDGYKSLEGKDTITDYLAHIDLICHHNPRRYFNIHDIPVHENHTISIDVKCATYQNWCVEEYYTAPFSRTLLSHGQNTIVLWCYMRENRIEIDGWIAAMWSGKLATQIYANRERYLQQRKITITDGLVGDPFYFIYLRDLILFFGGHVIGYDLECMTKRSLIHNVGKHHIKFI